MQNPVEPKKVINTNKKFLFNKLKELKNYSDLEASLINLSDLGTKSG